MLWLLDGKEPPKEADVEDELEERRRKEAVTPTEQPPILPIGTNKLLDTEETKELDETVKAADPFGYFEEIEAESEYQKESSNHLELEVPNPELTQENDTNVGLDHVEEMQPHQEELSADRHKQIGGDHYAKHTIQPWDIIREYKLDFFEGSCLKYLLRRKDNRLEDLQKAAHYLEECIKNEQKRMDDV
jgi:hypothetical protein